jgi:hypothetical protein
MLKKAIAIVLIMIGIVFANTNSEAWTQRQSPTGAKNSYLYFKEIVKKEPTFDNYWRLASSIHFYGEIFVTDNIQKKEIFTLGQEAASKAISLNNQEAIGYFLYTINTLELLKLKDSTTAKERLDYVKNSFETINRAIELPSSVFIEEEFESQNLCYLPRAVIYAYAPTPPVSIGDRVEAEKDFKKAMIGTGTKNRRAHRLYATFLISENRPVEALEIIDRGLAMPYNKDFPVNEDYEIRSLRELKSKI